MKHKLILIVEGQSDKIIVESILKAAKVKREAVSVLIAEGKRNAKKIAIQTQSLNNDVRTGLLMDLDIINLPDANNYIELEQRKNENLEVFFAVPEIEAWLFADDNLAIENCRSKNAKIILQRMPLPDEIPHPKQSASYLIKGYKTPFFLKSMNISRATSRSVSLYNFLKRISDITNINIEEIETPISKNLDRRVFINLLNEIVPSEKIVFKASNGEIYKVDDMVRHIKNETEIGREYTSDLLRVARDLLTRKANR